jgi:plastocyanin
MRRWTAITLILILAVAAACGGNEGREEETSEEETSEEGTSQIGGQSANDHGTEDVSGETSVELELDDFYFEPTVLRGDAGQSLTLEAFNEGDQAHTFTSEELSVDQELAPGEETSIDITFPDSGQVVFFCRFHDSQGMRGAIEVA